MTVLYAREKLKHNFLSWYFAKSLFFLACPVVIKLSAFQILHYNNNLLLGWQRERIVHFYNVFVFQASQGLYLFIHHMRIQRMVIKVKNLDCHFPLVEIVECQVHTPKTSLSKFAFEFEKFHANLKVKILS